MLATGTYLLLCCASILCAIYMFIKTFYRQLRPGEPPIVKGHPIWGSANAFNEHAVKFLLSAHKRYGDVFTIRLVNQYLTIINDPHSYDNMCKERAFDFDPIQKQVNWNVFSFVLRDPRKMIKETGKKVRGRYLNKGLNAYVNNLDHAYSKLAVTRPLAGSTQHSEWATDGLRVFTAKTMFDAIFNTVFGKSDESDFNSSMVFTNFDLFHKYFNLFWLGVPKKFFPSAMKALVNLCADGNSSQTLLNRDDCSDYMKTAISYMLAQGQTEQDIKGHNLVYLHVNYNTFRLAFWVLSYLLENPKALLALKAEINEVVESRSDGSGVSTLTVGDLEGMKVLNSVVQETSRVSCGVFMIRYVTKDTWFHAESSDKDYLMRKGDRVAVYPPAIHHDPEIFEDPMEYKYDRFVDTKFYKNGREVKHPVMTFGSLCPGKRYALLQLKWYITSIFSTFEMYLHEGEHAELGTQYHGHEILPPVKDVQMSYRFRADAPRLEFSQDD